MALQKIVTVPWDEQSSHSATPTYTVTHLYASPSVTSYGKERRAELEGEAEHVVEEDAGEGRREPGQELQQGEPGEGGEKAKEGWRGQIRKVISVYVLLARLLRWLRLRRQ